MVVCLGTVFWSISKSILFIWRKLVSIDRGDRNTTVRDAAKKIMGDVPIAYIEGVGGVRVAETDIVEIGKNDVGGHSTCSLL